MPVPRKTFSKCGSSVLQVFDFECLQTDIEEYKVPNICSTSIPESHILPLFPHTKMSLISPVTTNVKFNISLTLVKAKNVKNSLNIL